ncbi:uncharacterized protein LOC132194809 isoform X3 [Neocloeon triangulifer]|uniref:uncharacterized protein LOC132194809 isoform X3 n=1 Tax=Neocloeon triangulifer TaxID=2078957 RepID=UPI00286F5DD6|nr:uncharacterized protein LOC132194809 isoform X3 [Neocloeon triangulifer]
MDASDEMFRQDDEFLEYLMSLPKPQEEQRPLSQAAPADSKTSLEAPSKVGFDHLDNLCKLMEQLGDLKEQNNKLQRRVQYLEDLRALQEMHKQLLAQTQNSQESLLDKKKEDAETLETFEDLDRQHSEELEDGTLPTKAKVSKWTRVKEAFRWEKAQIEPQESRSQDSGIGLCPDRTGHVLQASVESRDISVGAEESVLLCSSQLLSSSSSSNEDLLDIELNFTALSEATNTFIEKSSELRQPSEQLMCRSTSPTDLETERRSKSTDSTHEESGLTKLEKKAGLKTPWSKVKNIIQTRRGSLKRRTVPGFARLSDDELEDEPLWQREHHRFRAEHQHKKLPVLTLTMPSTEEENAENAFAACQPRKEPFQRKISAPRSGSLGVSPPVARRPSKWTKVKKAFLTSRRYDEAPNAISMPSSPQAGGFKFSQHDDIKGARRKSTSGDMERPDRLTEDANHYHLSPQFRKRLLEWQIRRAISGKAAPQEEDDLHRELPEEFARKLEEWKKIKEGKLSPRLSRKDSEKVKVGQKEKQLQWLEKELGKVEREKQRLEREREKFLEREARLERMRRAMYPGEGRDGPEQEVLIQTSTGFFRFHGISEQFTKKLFEWEQQRGIAPEASTFALLDPKYHPEGEAEGGNLIRCKSVGSVAEQTTASSLIVQSQPSSLSLNDVEALEAELEENRMSSEPRLRADSFNRARTDSRSKPRSRSNSKSRPRPPIGRPPIAVQDVPSAVIVDVEATVEVTAPLRSIPCIQPEVPQWSTAEQEKMTLTQEDICTSEGQIHIKRADSVRSSSSHQLLEENMKLLAELKEKEAICRYATGRAVLFSGTACTSQKQLELEIEQIERKMHDVSHTQQKQLERLRREERDTDVRYEEPCEDRVQRLRRSVVDLGARRERLQMQTQALQDSFEEASQQQASLAQSLMDHMRLLKQGVEEEAAACPPQFRLDSAYVDPVAKVEALSAQLIIQAEKLEKALSSRNQREVPTRTTDLHTSASLGCLSQRSYEQTSSPRRSRVIHQKQSSQELAELPHLLTSKVLELQQGLNKICAASKEAETTTSPERETNTEDEDSESPTATFVVRLNRPQAPPPEEMPSSPQAFWRRVQVQSERSSSTSSSSSEFGKSDGSYSNEVLAALERKSTSQEHPPLDDLSETKPPSGRPDDSSEFEPRTPVRNCSLKRSKNFRTESRETWKQQQFVTSVSPSVTTTEASKLKTRRVSDTHVAYRSQEGPSVIVPTTRKIFSPVQSTNDSIIGYVVSESSSSSSDQRQQDVPPWRRVRDSQSASPALPRKMLCSSPESSPLRPRRLLGDGALPPPFPRSPTPCRKNANGEPKVTSPSIKQMVAKYNQRGNGAEPRASTPVWRSPVLERRDGQVKAQMTKYQDDIKKALQDGFTGARWRKSVQKSASAGAIRSPQTHEPQEPPPLLKSSSAGLIKCPVALTVEPLESQPPSTLTPPPPSRKHFELPKLEIKVESDLPPLKDPPPSPLDESIDQTLKEYRKKPASPQLLGNPRVHRAPCLRALKLKRAREEFLSRGPGSISASLGEPGCRLSQASAGSGSSYEDLLLGGNEGITKSASAGMINVEASTFHRLAAAPSTTLEASKSVSDMKPVRKSSGSLLFGFSSLASKFRKVRLRKKEHQCLSTVSQLCRQSLLVDLNVDKRTLPSTSTRDSSPSNLTNSESKSCPNSPEWMRKNLKR